MVKVRFGLHVKFITVFQFNINIYSKLIEFRQVYCDAEIQ